MLQEFLTYLALLFAYWAIGYAVLGDWVFWKMASWNGEVQAKFLTEGDEFKCRMNIITGFTWAFVVPLILIISYLEFRR